jgi:hypothetical protein
MTCREGLLGTHGHHRPELHPGATNTATAKHRASVVETAAGLESAGERGQKARKLLVVVAGFELSKTPAAVSMAVGREKKSHWDMRATGSGSLM